MYTWTVVNNRVAILAHQLHIKGTTLMQDANKVNSAEVGKEQVFRNLYFLLIFINLKPLSEKFFFFLGNSRL
jgi:hypothetical protein